MAAARKTGTGSTAAAERAGLQGVDRVVRLLSAVADGHASLARIASEANLSDATALRYLTSLVDHGLVERDAVTRHYRIGLRMFLLGRKAIGGRDFIAVANACLTRLVDLVGETANLGARVGDEVIIIQAVESTHPIRKGAAVGERDQWHASGLGKAMLGSLSTAEVTRILKSHGTRKLTDHTMTSMREVQRHLDAVRDQGFALDDQESVDGLCCVAVPVRDQEGSARYAISVSGPSYRLTTERVAELSVQLQQEARVLEAFLDHSPRPPSGVAPAR